MIVPDLNLLIYAANTASPQHARALRWWRETLDGDVPVLLAWVVVLGFLRITTHPRALPRPISSEDALAVVDGWLGQPCVQLAEPTERHWPILQDLLKALGTAGNLTTDLHLAAFALEHGASLHSADNDFARVPNLRWVNPLA